MQPDVRSRGATVNPRTGRLALTLISMPRDAPLQQVLCDLANRMTRMIEQAVDDGRDYEIQVRITADIAVDARQAKIGEYVIDLPIQVPDDVRTVETDGLVFHRTVLGWERAQ